MKLIRIGERIINLDQIVNVRYVERPETGVPEITMRFTSGLKGMAEGERAKQLWEILTDVCEKRFQWCDDGAVKNDRQDVIF